MYLVVGAGGQVLPRSKVVLFLFPALLGVLVKVSVYWGRGGVGVYWRAVSSGWWLEVRIVGVSSSKGEVSRLPSAIPTSNSRVVVRAGRKAEGSSLGRFKRFFISGALAGDKGATSTGIIKSGLLRFRSSVTSPCGFRKSIRSVSSLPGSLSRASSGAACCIGSRDYVCS